MAEDEEDIAGFVPSDDDEDDIELDDDDDDQDISAAEISNLLETKYNETGGNDLMFLSFLEVYSRVQPRMIQLLSEVFSFLVARGNNALVRLMLDHYDEDINIEYEAADIPGGGTSLTTAAREGHHQILGFLLENGARVDAKTRSGDTALDLVCATGDIGCIDLLLSHILKRFKGPQQEKNELIYYGMTMAAYNGHDEALRCFVEAGIDVNLNIDDDFGTSLHRSIEGGFIKCTDVLLDAGADVEALRHSVQQTPLMRAAEFGHVDTIRRLLNKGAKIDRMTNECSSALNMACHYGHTACVKYLLSRGANPHMRNPWGFTPLFMGADTPEIVQVLVDTGVSLDELCGERGEAAIHLAAVVGSFVTVKLLLDKGSDVNVKTNQNETSLWLAAWKGHTDVARLLIQKNCSLDDPSNGCQVYAFDYMPIEIAMGLGNFNIMKMILVAGCSLCNSVYYDEDDTGELAGMPWIKLRPEPLQMRSSHNAEYAWFRNFVRNPRSMKHLCRLRLRRLLGAPIETKIRQLELPVELRNYLLFSDL